MSTENEMREVDMGLNNDLGRRVAILEDGVAEINLEMQTVAGAMVKHSEALQVFSSTMTVAAARADRQASVMELMGKQIQEAIFFQREILAVQKESLPITLVIKLMAWLCGILSAMLFALLGVKQLAGMM